MASINEIDVPSKSKALTDEQIDAMLHEAEQRLSEQTRAPAVPHDRANRQREQHTSQQQPPEPKGKLAVRLPQQKRAEVKDTAGNDWFNIPKTDLTPQMKRDWQILRMRNVLDPKQQKKTLRAEPPMYSQVGEIVSGPIDFYSGRLTRKERKQNLLQEAFSERDEMKFRNRYAGIQKDKTSGKKAFYKKVVSERRKNKR